MVGHIFETFGDFIDKMKRIRKVPFQVTADVVSLHPSIPYKEGVLALKNMYIYIKSPQKMLLIIWLS